MDVRVLMPTDTAVYTALLVEGLEKQAQCFRITPGDIADAPAPFANSSDEDFTLGAFSEGGELLGVVSFAREKLEKLCHKGLIYRVYVSVGAAGRGIGRRLMQEAIARASDLPGLEQINLTVLAHNVRAKGLYSSLGFVTFAQEMRSIRHKGEYFDEEQMALQLKP